MILVTRWWCLSTLGLTLSTSALGQGTVEEREDADATAAADEGAEEDDAASRWLLSFEGAARVPVDIGGQVVLETPIRLRAFGGYGWVPNFYFDAVTNFAAVSGNTVLDEIEFSGRLWRVGGGVRPFSSIGLYLDGGYAQVSLEGSASLPALGTQEIETNLDMWFVELGYQGQIGGRLVLAVGLGVMGTADSDTSLSGTVDVPAPAAQIATQTVDDAFEPYGFVPTLTLRLGYDLI